MSEQTCRFCQHQWVSAGKACPRCIREIVGPPSEVVVFAAPGRDAAHALSCASLGASDIGDRFTVCEHPPGISAAEHWKATHERAAEAASEFVVVLEDDVLVNRHILYNIDTWRYKHDKETFGAGWLYTPGGYGRRDTWYTGTWEWYGTCGVLYKTSRLPFLIEKAWARMQEFGTPWDLAISWASHLDGRRLRVHHPALVEHLNDLPSKLGNAPGGLRDSGGTFSQDWMRPDKHQHGIYDQWGRRTV
jgi:hypothetical protein